MALYKEVISPLCYSPLHIEMAVVSHHGKGWAVFLPSNALLADRDHGAVKIEMGGERLVKELLNAMIFMILVHKYKNLQLTLSHREKLLPRIGPTCLNSYCSNFLDVICLQTEEMPNASKGYCQALPPDLHHQTTGWVKWRHPGWTNQALCTLPSGSCFPLLSYSQGQKRKIFLLLLWHENPQGLGKAPVHTFQSQSVKIGVGEQGRRQELFRMTGYVSNALRANLSYEKNK